MCSLPLARFIVVTLYIPGGAGSASSVDKGAKSICTLYRLCACLPALAGGGQEQVASSYTTTEERLTIIEQNLTKLKDILSSLSLFSSFFNFNLVYLYV